MRRTTRLLATLTAVLAVPTLAVAAAAPTIAATATPSASASAATASASATPSASATSGTTSSTSTDDAGTATGGSTVGDSATDGVGTDPSLATMNAAGDHSMGSTIATNDPQKSSSSTKSRSFSTLSASSFPSGTPGLDVSAWQTGIDWTSVYNAGARFAYVKATESTTYKSSQFATQYSGAYNAGMVRGAYHFAVPNASSGATQASYFVSNGGGWSADGRTLPPLLDIEFNPYSGTNSCYGLSTSAMVSWIKDFVTTVKTKTGITPAIYTNTSWWKTCTGNSAAFSANPLFVAYYTSNYGTSVPLGASWSSWTLWQYSSSGTFPGDSDTFAGTTSALASFAAGGTKNTPTPINSNAVTTLTTGKTMTAGTSLQSRSLQYKLAMQADGNLVLYGNGRALWQSVTSGNPGAHAVMQNDGNFVIYSSSGKAIWYTSTAGTGSTGFLTLTDEGTITVQTSSGLQWTGKGAGTDWMGTGNALTASQYLHSSSGFQQAVMQSDGNFVVYQYGRAVWNSRTSGQGDSVTLKMQKDGNLVLYKSGKALWQSITSGQGSSVTLKMQPDGNLVLYKSGKALWASNTAGS